jgi:hypothetical protein
MNEKDLGLVFTKCANWYRELGMRRKMAHMLYHGAQTLKGVNLRVAQKLMDMACPVYGLVPFSVDHSKAPQTVVLWPYL